MQPTTPTVDPGFGFWWNVTPAAVHHQVVLVNPNADTTTGYPAGHCLVPLPSGLPIGIPIFCQIVAVDGPYFAALRGTSFGVGR